MRKWGYARLYRIKHLLNNLKGVYFIENNGVEVAFNKHKIDYVFHCATNYGRKQNEPLQTVQANLILPLQILKIGTTHGLKVFFNTDTLLNKRVNIYSLSKKQFIEWLELTKNQITAVNIALEHFYGPGDDSSKFVSWLVDQVLNNKDSIPLTTGEQKRDFIFISDVLDAMVKIFYWAIDIPCGYYQFEVGTGSNVSIKDIAKLIASLADYDQSKLKFGEIPLRENEVMESKVNLTKLIELNWVPKTSLNDGLKILVSEEKKMRGV